MSKQKYSPNSIPDINADWGQDVTDSEKRPFSGQAVQNFVKDTFNSKIGYQRFYDTDNTYKYFASKEAADLYDSDPEEYLGLVIAQHEGQNPYYAIVTLNSESKVGVQSGTKGVYVNFSYDVRNNKTDQSTGEGALCTISITHNGSTDTKIMNLTYGQVVNFLLDDYLQDGQNTVTINIQGKLNTIATAQVAATYQVFNMALDTDLDISKYYSTSDTLVVDYSVSATQIKYLEWYLDGATKAFSTDTITQPSATGRTKNIDINLEEGAHSLQVRAYILYNDEKFYSETNYYQFYVGKPVDVELGLKVILPSGAYISAEDELTISCKQYEETSFSFAVLETKSRSLSVVITDNGTPLSTIVTTYGETQEFSYTPISSGEHTLKLTCQTFSQEIKADVQESSIDMDEASTNGLALRLLARGRSNAEETKDTWTYGDYSATFNDKVLFGAQDGWQTETDSDGNKSTAMVLKNGGVMEINIAPFTNNTTSTGKTIEIEYTSDDVEDDNAELITCLSESGVGLKITACEASLTSAGGVSTSSKFKPRERQKIAFVISKSDKTTYARFMFTILNGVFGFPAVYNIGDSFVNSVDKITFGNTDGKATLKIYAIRIYDRALEFDEELGNYVIDSPNPVTLASANDVYIDGTTDVSFEKLQNMLPTLMITCIGSENDFQKILDATDKKTFITGQLSYTHPDDPTLNFTATARVRKQGTSSLEYPRPNIKTDHYTNMLDADGNPTPSFDGKYQTYQFKHTCAPCDVHTWKADFMESSMSHNTGVARLWNDIMYNVQIGGEFVCRTKAQKAAVAVNHPYDVRTCVDGFPAVIFYRNGESGTPVFLGLYNFNTDKSDLGTFGWSEEGGAGHIEGYDPSGTECWEMLEEEGLCLMNSATDIADWDNKWDTYFEGRQPDGNTDTTNLKAFVQWVYSTKDDLAKWKAEKADHIDEWKMAAYYIYIMYYAAVDQVTKNSMLTQEGDGKWFFINYDNDTINGLNNSGFLKFLYDLMRGTITDPGTAYLYGYQGHDSVLFNNFEADETFMSKVYEMASAMYSAGLSYANSIDMFVNKQSKMFPERLHNASQEFKYLQSYLEGNTGYLKACQGTRESHVKYFLSKRSDLFEAMWAFGSYVSKSISMRFNGVVEGKQGILVTAGESHYFGVRSNNTNVSVGNHADKDETITLNVPLASNYGNIIYVMGANKIGAIDYHNHISNLATLDISGAYDATTGTKLKKLILSDDGTDNNTVLQSISGISYCEALEEIDIRRYQALTNIAGLDTLKNLHVFKALNSGITSFVPAGGTSFTEVSLPDGISVFSLDNVTFASNALTYTPTSLLRTISINKVTGLDTLDFMQTWVTAIKASSEGVQKEIFASAKITLKGINWNGVDADFMLYLKNNFLEENVQMTGYVMLNKLTTAEYKQIIEAYGENIFSYESTLRFDAPENIFVEVEGLTDGAVTAGKKAQIKATIFPLSTSVPQYRLYNAQGTIALYDATANTYTYDNIVLDGTTGVLSSSIKKTDTNCYVQAYKGSLESELFAVRVEGVVYVTEATLDTTEVTDKSSSEWTERTIHVMWGPDGYTVAPQNPTVKKVSGSASLEIVSWDASTYELVIKTMRPASAEETAVIGIYWTANDISYSKEVTITLKYIPVEAITISGADTLTVFGQTAEYSLAFTPTDANVGVVDWSVEIPESEIE